ncbi:MAG TPA: hypothetical protein VG412_11495 [Acidimicrobiales bacterium]|jgi:hypothetical protein|nr:hypothetical protein [Acidimicrobiales bacterium]
MAIITRQGSFPAGAESDADVSEKATSRQAALVNAIARIRVRTRAIKVEQILLVVGGVAMPAGLLVIVVGWYGAAHTFRTYAQLDYLISGGLLGLGLVVFGGFCYFAYWLTRMVQLLRTAQTQDRQSLDALERISAQLAQLTPATAAAVSGIMPVPSPGAVPGLVATVNGTMAHLPSCPVVANNPDLRPASVGDPNLTPCQICQPYAPPG